MTTSSDPIFISFVATSYNDGAYLVQNITEVIKVLSRLQYSFEIVIVDDKSTDNSVSDIETFIRAHEGEVRFQFLRHEVNRGRGRTVSDGILAARGTYVGYIDIDLSTSPWYIPQLIALLERGADISAGYRHYTYEFKVLHRVLLSWGYRWLLRLILGGYYGDTETGCKFFVREKITPILPLIKDERWFWDTEVMVRGKRAGLVIAEVPTVFVRRDGYTTVKLLRDSLRAFRNLLRLRRELYSKK
jgi:glycosyltransferase involved in cell wall biosynthesis